MRLIIGAILYILVISSALSFAMGVRVGERNAWGKMESNVHDYWEKKILKGE